MIIPTSNDNALQYANIKDSSVYFCDALDLLLKVHLPGELA